MSDESKKMIKIPDDDNELLEECDVFTFRSSGKGGQNVNKTESAVRLVHRPTGIVVISRKERSQYLNKKDCLIRLREKIKKLTKKEPPRISTVVSLRVKAKRRIRKEKSSKKKDLRRKPLTGED